MKEVDPPRFFEAIARRYDRVYALDAAATRERMRRVLEELPPASRVLDLGVGTGRELSALQDAGHAPTGLDVSPAMIALCQRRARPVPVVLADLWGPLPFADGAFDACIALHGTLAHPTSAAARARGDESAAYEALAAELARVIRAGGAFLAEVPAPSLLDALAKGAMIAGDMTLRLAGADRVVHEDLVASVSVEALVLPPECWRALFAPWFTVAVEPLGPFEMRVVAHRR